MRTTKAAKGPPRFPIKMITLTVVGKEKKMVMKTTMKRRMKEKMAMRMMMNRTLKKT